MLSAVISFCSTSDFAFSTERNFASPISALGELLFRQARSALFDAAAKRPDYPRKTELVLGKNGEGENLSLPVPTSTKISSMFSSTAG